MPHRDDFEDFDRETENLVAQIADKSVEDEDVDVALKLAQCDIYERRLREQVRNALKPIFLATESTHVSHHIVQRCFSDFFSEFPWPA